MCWCACWDFFLSFSFCLGLLFFHWGYLFGGERPLGHGGRKNLAGKYKKNVKRLESLCNCSFTVISECSTRRNIVKWKSQVEKLPIPTGKATKQPKNGVATNSTTKKSTKSGNPPPLQPQFGTLDQPTTDQKIKKSKQVPSCCKFNHV